MTRKKGSKERVDVKQVSSPESTNVKQLSPQEQAEYLGGLQFTVAEVAIILGEKIEGELRTAYDRGRLLEEAKVREAIKRLAIRGSAPAQKQFTDLTRQSKANDIYGKK